MLEDISLVLHQGTVAFLQGANGSGKSTLLRCLAGWTPYEEGSITLCSEDFDPTSRELRRLLYFVPETPPFYDDLTALEHIRLVLGANDLMSRAGEADDLLVAFGLYAVRNQYPSSYSHGMREKLSLVIAFTLRPQLLLLDEPYGPLDSKTSLLLSKEISRLVSGAQLFSSAYTNILPSSLQT